MKYHRALLLAGLVGALLFILNVFANWYGWYDHISFFDKGMHMLGGIFVACALLWSFFRYCSKEGMRTVSMLFLTSLFVGLLWEVYEYIVQGITGTHLATIPDSLGDLAADAIGAAAGILLCWGKKTVQ
ncbi:hypothetical protein IT401_02600 [Candidatus Nomurabacteria bacterium]|nr:hypothetical protein [Candidatus Nomurabacteria bacterium]